MTVRELIEYLEKSTIWDQEKPVCIWQEDTATAEPITFIDIRDDEIVFHP